MTGSWLARVVVPEELPLAEQVRLVRDSEVVAGFAGSAMLGSRSPWRSVSCTSS